MKKLIDLATMTIFILVLGLSMAEAELYQPLSKEATSAVEIPDEMVLPDYISRLSLYKKDDTRRAIDLSPLIINLFFDPEFQYLNEEGNEECPYAELIKVEKNSGRLIYFTFINEKNEFESYEDESPKILWSPATGRLKKETRSKENDNSKFKKVPREK
ncbi:MAG: hypothetical protein Q8L57_00630 [bacterium]|nr:hypothetical protein [bacterium]